MECDGKDIYCDNIITNEDKFIKAFKMKWATANLVPPNKSHKFCRGPLYSTDSFSFSVILSKIFDRHSMEASEALNESAHKENEKKMRRKRVSIKNATFYVRAAPPCGH